MKTKWFVVSNTTHYTLKVLKISVLFYHLVFGSWHSTVFSFVDGAFGDLEISSKPKTYSDFSNFNRNFNSHFNMLQIWSGYNIPGYTWVSVLIHNTTASK